MRALLSVYDKTGLVEFAGALDAEVVGVVSEDEGGEYVSML